MRLYRAKERLALVMRVKAISGAELARRTGITQPNVSLIITGRLLATQEQMQKIQAVVGRSKLFEEVGE